MAWTCYTCGTKNPNSADACKQCGGNVAAPKSFYIHWVFGGAAFFLIAYIAGTFVGGTLVEVAVAPTEAEIMAKAKEDGATAKSTLELEPDQLKKAKKKAIDVNKGKLSSVVKNLLFWFLPFLFFLICGAIVGFVSDGKTVIEAGLGSAIGQAGGFLLQRFVWGTDIGTVALIVGLVVGIGLAVAGAWVGEIIQERRERAG